MSSAFSPDLRRICGAEREGVVSLARTRMTPPQGVFIGRAVACPMQRSSTGPGGLLINLSVAPGVLRDRTGRTPMRSALPVSDRVDQSVLGFIHRHATSIPDEIIRAEATLRALPEMDLLASASTADPGTCCMHQHLNSGRATFQGQTTRLTPLRISRRRECTRPTRYFFGPLLRSSDSPNRLEALDDAGVLGFTCLGFLASLLLRFWPLAITFASESRDRAAVARPRSRAVRPSRWPRQLCPRGRDRGFTVRGQRRSRPRRHRPDADRPLR